jgi:hypothetical protein
MKPGDLVELNAVAKLYLSLETRRDCIDDRYFGILISTVSSESDEIDSVNDEPLAEIWNVLVDGRVERVWQLDMIRLNKRLKDDIVNVPSTSSDSISDLDRVFDILLQQGFLDESL